MNTQMFAMSTIAADTLATNANLSVMTTVMDSTMERTGRMAPWMSFSSEVVRTALDYALSEKSYLDTACRRRTKKLVSRTHQRQLYPESERSFNPRRLASGSWASAYGMFDFDSHHSPQAT